MPKDTKTLGNNKARACESLGFVHKKRLCQRFYTTSPFVRMLRIVVRYVPSVGKGDGFSSLSMFL